MHKYLLLINLGPVQGFIATARRTRDLYAGSRLLSDAAYMAAKSLAKNKDTLLIFPAPGEDMSLDELKKAGIANIILAYLQEPRSPDELKKFMNNVEQSVRQFLREEAKERLDLARKIKDKNGWAVVPSNEAKEAGLAQVEHLLEFYWVALPFDAEKDDYQQSRKLIYKLMNGRKSVRDFVPTDAWSKAVPKSSLDGALESVTSLRWVLGREPLNERKPHTEAKLSLGLRPGEELSGVDLLKRLYLKSKDDEDDFPLNFASTTHMAVLPFLQGLDEKKREQLIENFNKLVLDFKLQNTERRNPKVFYELFDVDELDPRLLFPSRFSEFGLEGDLLRDVQRKAANIFKQLGKEPYPYYVILHADGDHMGKVIDALAAFGPEKQRELSVDLAKFAKGVRKIVESKKHLGSLVYSGGDDVLALLPLHTALECARKLANTFKSCMQNFKVEDENKKQISPTFSVGLAVVHHLFDLGEALNLARKAEKAAKEKRNSLAVIVAPRSGVELLVKGQWDEEDPIDKRLETYARWLHEGHIPTGWAYELRSLAKLMDADELSGALAAEAIRILERKSKASDDVKKILSDRLKKKAEEAKALADELIVARYFARAFELAGKLESKREGNK